MAINILLLIYEVVDNAFCQCETEGVEEKSTKRKKVTQYTIVRIFPCTSSCHFSSINLLKKIDLIKCSTIEKNSVNKINFTSKSIELKLF